MRHALAQSAEESSLSIRIELRNDFPVTKGHDPACHRGDTNGKQYPITDRNRAPHISEDNSQTIVWRAMNGRGQALVALTLVAVLVSGSAIVGRMLTTAARGDTASLHQQLIMTLIGMTSVVILLCAVFSQYLPGAVRRQTLRGMFPEALVLNARMNRTLAPAFRRLEPSAEIPGAAAKPPVTFGVVTDGRGVTFWLGICHPQQFGCLPWDAIGRITVESTTMRGIRFTGLQIECLGGAPLFFLVGSEHFFGIVPAGNHYLADQVQQLETLRKALR